MDAPEESNPPTSRCTTLRGWFRPCMPDARRALALFGMAFVMGVVYVSTWGGPPEFWQQIFGPSVMMACGEGFVNPHLDDVPGLEDFLYLHAETFPCENIPADVRVLPADTSAMEYDAVQEFHP